MTLTSGSKTQRIEAGGDTDTIASITGQIAGLGSVRHIPLELINSLQAEFDIE